MTRAFALYRVSTQTQAEKGFGLKAQQDTVRQYAIKNGLELVSEFVEAGVSGAAPLEKRTGLLQALAALKKDDILLVAKQDRLARDLLLQLTIEKLVSKKGASIISCCSPVSSDSASDTLLRNLLASVAQFERSVNSERTAAAHRARKARGLTAGHPPYGYSVDEDKKLVKNKEEQLVVQAVRLGRQFGLNWRQIANILNGSGYFNRSGKRWSLHNLRAIFIKREGFEKTRHSDEHKDIWVKFICLPLPGPYSHLLEEKEKVCLFHWTTKTEGRHGY